MLYSLSRFGTAKYPGVGLREDFQAIDMGQSKGFSPRVHYITVTPQHPSSLREKYALFALLMWIAVVWFSHSNWPNCACSWCKLMCTVNTKGSLHFAGAIISYNLAWAAMLYVYGEILLILAEMGWGGFACSTALACLMSFWCTIYKYIIAVQDGM